MTDTFAQPPSRDPAGPPLWSRANGGAVLVAPLNSALMKGPAVGLLFDSFGIELRGTNTGRDTVQCASVRAYPDIGDKPAVVEIRYELYGDVQKDADARVALLADFDGTLRTAEYGYGTPATGRVKLEATSRRTVHPCHGVMITLLLTGERLNDAATANLWIDLVDAEITVLDHDASTGSGAEDGA